MCHRSDEEVSDPKALLEERTKAKCVKQWYEYQVKCCFISYWFINMQCLLSMCAQIWLVCLHEFFPNEFAKKTCRGPCSIEECFFFLLFVQLLINCLSSSQTGYSLELLLRLLYVKICSALTLSGKKICLFFISVQFCTISRPDRIYSSVIF